MCLFGRDCVASRAQSQRAISGAISLVVEVLCGASVRKRANGQISCLLIVRVCGISRESLPAENQLSHERARARAFVRANDNFLSRCLEGTKSATSGILWPRSRAQVALAHCCCCCCSTTISNQRRRSRGRANLIDSPPPLMMTGTTGCELCQSNCSARSLAKIWHQIRGKTLVGRK